MGSITPAVYAISPLIGVSAYLALHNLWIWLGRRSEPLHLWVSVWCANSLLYLTSHYVQIASALPEHAVLGGRLAWTSAIALIVMTIGLSHALAGVRLPRRLIWPVGILNAGLLLLVWLTSAIVSDRAYVRTDLLGYQYGAPVPGPLLPLLAPYILGVFAYAWRTLGRAEMDPRERRAIRAGFAVYVVLALNDMLHAARLIQSIRVFDLGFVAVGVGLTYMPVRRYNRLYAHLEAEVSVRTQVALALDNARLREGLARPLGRVETLARVSRLVSASLDRDSVLREISRSAALLMGVPVANFWLADEERRTIELVGVSDPVLDADWPMRALSFDEGPAGWVATHRHPLNVPDAFADERPLDPDWWRAHGLRSYHGVPVLHEGSLLGAGPIRVEPEDEALLEAFVAQAAVAIKNALLYGSARAQAQELEALHDVRSALVSTPDLPRVLETIATSAMRLVKADGAAVFELDPRDGLLRPRTSYGRGGDVAPLSIRLGQGAAGTAAVRREPVWSADVHAQPLPGYDEVLPGTDTPLARRCGSGLTGPSSGRLCSAATPRSAPSACTGMSLTPRTNGRSGSSRRWPSRRPWPSSTRSCTG